MKKFLSIFAVAALALAAAVSCSDKEDDETTVDLKAISLSSPSLDLFVGDESTLTVKYTPENATNKPAATWTSSNESVASVSEGKVSALAAGEATITATVEKFTATCTVKVSEKDSYTGPVQGNSAWSVIGALLGTNWDTDYVCAEEDGIFVLKNVRLQATDQFKFRKDKNWDDNRGAAGDVEPFVVTVGEAFDAVAGGKNLSVAENGLYDLYYNANVEQIAVVALDGTPTWAEPQPISPTQFAALEDNTEATFEGVVAAVGKNGVVVTDGTTNIYVFKPATTPAVGDKVSVEAKKTTYYKLIETAQGGKVTVLGSGNEVPATTPVDITATFDAYPDEIHTSDLLKVEGQLVVDGSYVNLIVEGATVRQGSLQGLDVTALNGKNVVIEGYYIGTSGSGGKFLTIIVTGAEEVSAPGGNSGEDLDDPTDVDPWK